MARANEESRYDAAPAEKPPGTKQPDKDVPADIRERALHRVRFAPTRFKALISIVEGLPKDAAILDFGCGSGRNTYALLDLGYTNVCGFDIKDYLKLRSPQDRALFCTGLAEDGRLPYADGTFDLVLSDQVFEHVRDQVAVFEELHRITRRGGRHFHIIPSPYRLVEPHIRVPLGSFISRPAWYRFWARLGFRGKFAHALSAAEAAERALLYRQQGLHYVSSAVYKVIWRRLGFDYRFVDQEYFDTHWRTGLRLVGRANRVLPVFGWLKRVFRVRHVLLTRLA